LRVAVAVLLHPPASFELKRKLIRDEKKGISIST